MNCSSQSLNHYYIMNSISIRAQHISILFYFHTFQLLTFSAGRIFLESYNCISHYWVNQLSLFAAPLAIGDNSRGPSLYIKPDDSSQKIYFCIRNQHCYTHHSLLHNALTSFLRTHWASAYQARTSSFSFSRNSTSRFSRNNSSLPPTDRGATRCIGTFL